MNFLAFHLNLCSTQNIDVMENRKDKEKGVTQNDETTGSGYAKQDRDKNDATNNELDKDYYDDKENPERHTKNTSVDSNRSGNLGTTEGVEPNR